MQISRRDFLKLVGVSAVAVGLSTTEFGQLEEALASPTAPTVLWLQGAACTGCSVSFLNRISTTAPTTAGDVLINSINLAYHPNIMAASGQSAVNIAQQVYNKGNYILVIEGGVPTMFGGKTCLAWTSNGVDVPFKDAVTTLASRAAKVICVGTCASWGGMAAAPPNPTGVQGVKALTGITTINIAGCPPHPDWIVWAIVQLLLNKAVVLDSYGRPTTLFGETVHSHCPRRETDEDSGGFGIDNHCLREHGCRGPETPGNCPSLKWNNGVNWCVDANFPCLGCTNPTFPGTQAFSRSGGGDD